MGRGGYPNGEESDSKSDAGLPVAGSSPVPSAHLKFRAFG